MKPKLPKIITFRPDLHLLVRSVPRQKTQTRRLIRFQESWEVARVEQTASDAGRLKAGTALWNLWDSSGQFVRSMRCRYGAAGDALYVGEPLYRDEIGHVCYQLDNETLLIQDQPVKWWWNVSVLPGMYMPRWAARDFLTVQEIRVQRLQEISEADARAEGVENLAQFEKLWNAINGKRASWKSNPWVWALTFPETETQDLSHLLEKLLNVP